MLVTGATGNGKSTTMAAMLQRINQTRRAHVVTIEDPIEFLFSDDKATISQREVGTDTPTFKEALRNCVRQDPDVIMVGEMRDLETMSTAITAAETGHLVFSTLHTNSAPETITRLLDMDIDPFNFADALLGILAQRLVRTLCTCKEAYHPSQEEFAELMESYGVEYWDGLGVRYSPEFTLHRPKGCTRCNNTGYKGRMGIHELLVASDELKRMIQRRTPVEQIRQQAMQEGMTTLLQDGILKVMQGHTDFPQVRAVCIK